MQLMSISGTSYLAITIVTCTCPTCETYIRQSKSSVYAICDFFEDDRINRLIFQIMNILWRLSIQIISSEGSLNE